MAIGSIRRRRDPRPTNRRRRPEENDIWVPGYWAWGEGGYYWSGRHLDATAAAGLSVDAGYWAANNSNAFVWHQGYWGPTVGFYGGINYGAGYYGHGYVGGRWSGNQFQYNTAVTPVNRTVIHNVYVDKTVIVNNTTVNNHTSYNGGPHGVAARPTAAELTAARAPHKAMTPPQIQHAQVAGQDRRNLARSMPVNRRSSLRRVRSRARRDQPVPFRSRPAIAPPVDNSSRVRRQTRRLRSAQRRRRFVATGSARC